MSTIGSTRRFALHLFQRFGLAPLRDILPSDEFTSVAHETDCTPGRRRPLIPEVVAWLMMYVGLLQCSMTQGLVQAWGLMHTLCPGLPDKGPSEPAFTQARRQLPLRFWRVLWQHLGQRYEQKFASRLLWKQRYRVLAVDGTEVALPNAPALVRFFGRPKNGKNESRQPQGRLVAVCSVFTGFCFDFTFTALRFTEHLALDHLIRRMRKNDLLLLDRGFFSLRGDLASPVPRGPFPHAGVARREPVRQEATSNRPRRLAYRVYAHAGHPA